MVGVGSITVQGCHYLSWGSSVLMFAMLMSEELSGKEAELDPELGS